MSPWITPQPIWRRSIPGSTSHFFTGGGQAVLAALGELQPGGSIASPTFRAVPAGVDLCACTIKPDGARLAAFDVKPLEISIDRKNPLGQTAQALTYSQTGRARGKILLRCR